MEHDLDEELQFHLQMEIGENLRKGMTPQHARFAALRRFGGIAWTVTALKPKFSEVRLRPHFGTYHLRAHGPNRE
jgi:hypothetical protein